ncbi:hypothetical protein BGW36DRAFT_386795 [Talaromyces proteolyticus]|uniref:Secreted protein n=1 Tax=Talaromyces proteolyticus TaxID=1131652 RepID=A0AAD4KLJ0_9EURO|nr:uncharacterized protein BGW36DRAFT_386795 [Talaromyces proteolyticus]KAH8692001.1 hypothetical protein BGW36DRAFT_386795 [Talaromyces proteolyticus]
MSGSFSSLSLAIILFLRSDFRSSARACSISSISIDTTAKRLLVRVTYHIKIFPNPPSGPQQVVMWSSLSPTLFLFVYMLKYIY